MDHSIFVLGLALAAHALSGCDLPECNSGPAGQPTSSPVTGQVSGPAPAAVAATQSFTPKDTRASVVDSCDDTKGITGSSGFQVLGLPDAPDGGFNGDLQITVKFPGPTSVGDFHDTDPGLCGFLSYSQDPLNPALPAVQIVTAASGCTDTPSGTAHWELRLTSLAQGDGLDVHGEAVDGTDQLFAPHGSFTAAVDLGDGGAETLSLTF